MGLSTQSLSIRPARGGRERFVRASTALGVFGVAVLAAIPTFGTRRRHAGIGACSYDVVSRAPGWMWAVGIASLTVANVALAYARGIRVHDTQANRVMARVLRVVLLAAVVWFVWAQFGYHQIACEF